MISNIFRTVKKNIAKSSSNPMNATIMRNLKFKGKNQYLVIHYCYEPCKYLMVQSAIDPLKLSLADRVRLFDPVTSPNSTHLPPCSNRRSPPTRTSSSSNRRRIQSSLLNRFQTQPITVDEVQEASRQMWKVNRKAGWAFSGGLSLIRIPDIFNILDSGNNLLIMLHFYRHLLKDYLDLLSVTSSDLCLIFKSLI